MRIKNKDIAEALGISTTAVSLAINNRPGVSEETRRKVLQMISESASRNAENHEAGTSRSMVVLSVHKRTGLVINEKPFFSELVETVQQEAMLRRYLVAIAHYMPGMDRSSYTEYLRSLSPAGIIVMATEMAEEDLGMYTDIHVPLVLMDGTFDLSTIDSIALDNQTAIYRAFDYAYRCGHRDIGFLKSETVIRNFVHHFDGYKKGIRDYGLEGRNNPVVELPCTMEGARDRMNHFLDHLPEGFEMPTVFLADLDYIAIGAMQAFEEHGYRVPDDISFIGYDDVAAASLCNPPLTTSRVNHGDAGRLAMQRLSELLEGKHTNYHLTAQLSSQLIVRDSVKILS